MFLFEHARSRRPAYSTTAQQIAQAARYEMMAGTLMA